MVEKLATIKITKKDKPYNLLYPGQLFILDKDNTIIEEEFYLSKGGLKSAIDTALGAHKFEHGYKGSYQLELDDEVIPCDWNREGIEKFVKAFEEHLREY